jgi:predicted NodU family carbamoyl transferase
VAEIFDGPMPCPGMRFTHGVRGHWGGRIVADVHGDGAARLQTVAAAEELPVHRMLEAFARRTRGPPASNTSLDTDRRPRSMIPATPSNASARRRSTRSRSDRSSSGLHPLPEMVRRPAQGNGSRR